MTQARLGECCGYEPMTISRFERGENSPGFDALVMLAEALEIPLHQLVQLDDNDQMSASQIRQEICELVFRNNESEQLTEVLKAVRKVLGGK